MKDKRLFCWVCVCVVVSCVFGSASALQEPGAIYSGVPWYDQNGNTVSAHGACIVKEGDTFYLFGEYKSDESNVFNGFSCYSSKDLYNWKFERIALPVQEDGRLGPNRVGERPKVIKCPKTGKYVMYMHTDDINYKDCAVGYAVSDKIAGVYDFKGTLNKGGKPIKKWDMGTFQDDDGSGYLITHSGNLYRLSDDYEEVDAQIVEKMTGKCESPAILKKDGVYFWMGSDLTSWERNDNYYFRATALEGPWEKKGFFAPEGTLTWNSQCSFVFPIVGEKETTYMYMGDRWAFPRQNSCATYVWQPLEVTEDTIALPDFKQAWTVDLKNGEWQRAEIDGRSIDLTDRSAVTFSESWTHDADSRSNAKGASVSVSFTGSQIGFYGVARPDGGYATIRITDAEGKEILSSMIDMYCKYEEESLKFLSPVFPQGQYTLTVTVEGARGNWSDKRRDDYGSTDDYVSVSRVVACD